MKDRFLELNNLYKTVIENTSQLRNYLGSKSINHALNFDNTHHIKVEIKCKV